MNLARLLRLCSLFLGLLAVLAPSLGFGQHSTGNIEGTVLDATGAVLPNAQVTVTDESTGVARKTATDSTGLFRAIELQPGNYTVEVSAAGFNNARDNHLVVRLGVVTPIEIKLQVGQVTEVTEVSASEIAVDTNTTQVEGVVNQQQIEQLAIIGRNVADLAQVQPGVQIRDGGDVDPTKNNFSIISIQGRGGRETQMQWDGLSVEDYSVGGSVVNISLDGIQEFQVAQATLDPSQSVATGGAVNIISRRGSNGYHGSAYEFFRSDSIGAAIGGIKAPFERNQFGGRFGGPIVRDRLFFFLDAERTKTDDSFVGDPPGFPQYHTFFAKPFRDNFAMTRVDATLTPRWNAFARLSYTKNSGVVGAPLLGGTLLNGFNNRTQSNIVAAGLTYAGGNWTHEFRFGHVAFNEQISNSSVIPTPVDALGRPFSLVIDAGATLAIGPNLLTNQLEGQRTWQAKYDGAYLWGKHTSRFGFDFVHWLTLGDFPLLINGPQLNTSSALSTSTNPLDFPVIYALLGNAQGYLSEKPVLNLPHGGTFQTRPALYFHDIFKLRRNLTLNYGLRWFYMSDIVNPDIKRSPLLDQFQPGLSAKRQPARNNFSPQVGLAWDPRGNGKTVIRAAAGLQYLETTVDIGGTDRVPFMPAGIGLEFGFLAPGVPLVDPRTGNPFAPGDPLAAQFGFPNGTDSPILAPLFTQPISAVSTQFNNLSQLYQAASAVAAQNPNQPTNFDLLREISYVKDFTLSWGPKTSTPRTFQVTVGAQHELKPGVVVGAEYVHSRDYKFPAFVDLNRIGAGGAQYFDPHAAVNAISTTNAGFGCPANALAGSISCAIAAGAQIRDYGANGLGAGPGFQGFAFRGVNPNFGVLDFLEPISSSDYDAMNLRLEGRFGQANLLPFRWMRSNFVTATYTLSRKTGDVKPGNSLIAADQGNFPAEWDNINPQNFRGPFSLDRRHLLNISTITEVPAGFRFSTITHWYSKLPQNPLLPVAFAGCDGAAAEIFCSDFTVDGTTSDLLPTAPGPGSYGRSLANPSDLNNAIGAYNSKFAGQLTPAGQTLVSSGLFTAGQLQQLGAVMPTLSPAPAGAVGVDPLFTADLRVSWHHAFRERFEVEPMMDVFNVFNRTNYDPPSNVLAGDLTGTAGHINGTTNANRTNFRQRGSGTFEQGANRQLQFGLRVSF